MVYRVELHPHFVAQLSALSDLAAEDGDYLDLLAEVSARVQAVEESGHDVEEENHHDDAVSHPIVTSKYRAFALRRTPPTAVTPYAVQPPVLRIPYVWFTDTETHEEVAVVMFIGNKTDLGNDWYPSAVQRIDNASMVTEWPATTQHRNPK